MRDGGRYDGALGVVCALEVLRAVKDAGLDLPVALEAVDFTDEEGTLIGTLGSWRARGLADAASSFAHLEADVSLLVCRARAHGADRGRPARRPP